MWKFFLAISALALLAGGCGGNHEGVVKTDDCREHIQVTADSWDATAHSYTCQTYKDNQGVITGQMCERVVLDDNGHCLKDYWYSYTK